MKRMLPIILTVLLILPMAGCSKGGTDVPPVPEEDAALKTVTAFLDSDPSVSEIGAYIRIPPLPITGEIGDMLLERLILTQFDTMESMNRKIYDEPYMTALNVAMGGILDGTKISTITNETVKNDFQEVFDGFMTIVRYEETPVVETDWVALVPFIKMFSIEAANMVDLQSRIQNRYYFGDPYKFDLLADDIAFNEQKIRESQSKFVRWQLNRLYDRQISNLLVGPEGSYLNELSAGEKTAVDRITNYADTYKDSSLGKLCSELLALNKPDMMAMSELISFRTYFDVGDSKTLLKTLESIKQVDCNLIRISGLSDQAAEDKINGAILASAEALIVQDMAGQFVSAYVSFANSNYLSVSVSNSYTDAAGMFQFYEDYINFDLNTGEEITLDDLFGASFDTYKEKLILGLKNQKFIQQLDAMPEFQLFDQGIMFKIPDKTSAYSLNDQISINFARKFMDISLFY